MLRLLKADEDRLRSTLRANADAERCRELSVETLDEELGSMLLRYNAACAPDRMRQTLADCLAAPLRDALSLLRAGGAEKKLARRETPASAPLLLLAAVILTAAGVLLAGKPRLAAILCLAFAAVAAFAAGRLWFREREVSVRATVDPEAVWAAMQRTGETMDRKIGEFCERAKEWQTAGQTAAGGAAPDRETLELLGDLLEALYAENGDFALRQMKKIRPYLRRRGIEAVDYSGENAELFELFPSKRPSATQRPALLAGDRLLLGGRATERTD